jgi:rubredoxin
MKIERNICTECNAIYEEPEEMCIIGRPKFAALPEKWNCECGAQKDSYQPCLCVTLKPEHKKAHKPEAICLQV